MLRYFWPLTPLQEGPQRQTRYFQDLQVRRVNKFSQFKIQINLAKPVLWALSNNIENISKKSLEACLQNLKTLELKNKRTKRVLYQ